MFSYEWYFLYIFPHIYYHTKQSITTISASFFQYLSYTNVVICIKLRVSENVPIPKLRKNPSFDPMYIGERVNFTCKVDVSSGWNYQWFKDGLDLGTSGDTISIVLDLSKGGQYSCTAKRSVNTETGHSEKKKQVCKGKQKEERIRFFFPLLFITKNTCLQCETFCESFYDAEERFRLFFYVHLASVIECIFC